MGSLKPLIVAPDGGTDINAFGNTIQFKLRDEDTGGALTLGFAVVPPGHGPPPHVHHKDDEIFVVMKGRFEYYLDGETHVCGPGTVVFLPKECPHTFKCVSEEAGEKIVITIPAGFDRFYERCSEEFATGQPDFGRLSSIAREHGYEFLTGK